MQIEQVFPFLQFMVSGSQGLLHVHQVKDGRAKGITDRFLGIITIGINEDGDGGVIHDYIWRYTINT